MGQGQKGLKEKTYRRALFLFRRDLRLEDNTGLLFALKEAKEVVLGFVFTAEQIERNPYRSDHCLQFMIESLEDLGRQAAARGGRLYLFSGKPEEIVSRCIASLDVDAVIVNSDYTPYSLQRDRKIEAACKKKKVPFFSFEDVLLYPVAEIGKSDGKPYTVFTPFYRAARCVPPQKPRKNLHTNYCRHPIAFSKDVSFYRKILPRPEKQQKGGREEGLKILRRLASFADYGKKRDYPSEEKTTHLSAHLKFTTISAREVYEAVAKKLGEDSELIRSLYWRDFFTSIAFYFPHVFKGAFRKKYDALSWSGDRKKFALWCEGKTGVPIVDAGMRQMNQTGFMHNRVRMITASFLVKDLHVDWRLGEKYFAQTLIDYDPAVNNGNWQWVASTGCDAQPYFRIFNPWNQAKRFDPGCLYIKKWIPELKDLEPKSIHGWHLEKNRPSGLAYPAPIVDHALEAKASLKSYRSIPSSVEK